MSIRSGDIRESNVVRNRDELGACIILRVRAAKICRPTQFYPGLVAHHVDKFGEVIRFPLTPKLLALIY